MCIECPTGWTKSIDETCIRVNGTVTDIEKAIAICNGMYNSRLVETYNVAKLDFVSNFVISQSGSAYYVNGFKTKYLSPYSFVWGSNLSPFDATGQWANTEPDGDNQPCLDVCLTGDCKDGSGLYDVACSNGRNGVETVVCELPCECFP